MGSDKPSDKPSEKIAIMTGAVRDMFNTHNRGTQLGVGQKGQKQGGKNRAELELALTVLLVELASCDQNFDMREYNMISDGLRRVFGTSKSDVQALVNQANVTLSNLRGTSKFAELLRDNLTEADRTAVMDVIDQMILTDGVEDGFETYLKKKIGGILGIKSES